MSKVAVGILNNAMILNEGNLMLCVVRPLAIVVTVSMPKLTLIQCQPIRTRIATRLAANRRVNMSISWIK